MLQYFEFLKQLKLPNGEFAIFGSGPLIVRGIIEPANDLDVICRRAAWEAVRKIGSLQFDDDYCVEIVRLFDGKVTFGNRWGIGDFDTDELIDNAEIIVGLPFVTLDNVIRYKSIRQTEKDLRHIESFERSEHFVPVRKGG